MKFCQLVLPVLAVLICESASVLVKSHGKILGDGDGAIDAWPWLVYLTINGYDSEGTMTRNCAGTIISPNQILTAASCLQQKNSIMTGVGIMMGRTSLTSIEEGGETITFNMFKGAVPHAFYSEVTNINNIALLNLPHDLPINPDYFIEAVTLATPDLSTGTEDQVLIAGWGGVNETKTDILQAGTFLVESRRYCETIDPAWDETTKMCFSVYGADISTPCQLDIGGPIIYVDPIDSLPKLIGVITTAPCGNVDIPTFAARITGYEAWILANTP